MFASDVKKGTHEVKLALTTFSNQVVTEKNSNLFSKFFRLLKFFYASICAIAQLKNSSEKLPISFWVGQYPDNFGYCIKYKKQSNTENFN